MALRKSRLGEPPATRLDVELAQEMASTLGRLGRALEAALSELAAFDATPHRHERAARAPLVHAASVALWHFLVQRECLGLRNSGPGGQQVLRDYRVPNEVFATMGAGPPASARTDAAPPRGQR